MLVRLLVGGVATDLFRDATRARALEMIVGFLNEHFDGRVPNAPEMSEKEPGGSHTHTS